MVMEDEGGDTVDVDAGAEQRWPKLTELDAPDTRAMSLDVLLGISCYNIL
jgi:hypothetical protein